MRTKLLLAWIASCCFVPALSAQSLTCSLADYKPAPGLTASFAGDTLALTWDGDRDQELRLRLGVENWTPIVRELAVRRKGGQWGAVLANVRPEFRIVTGFRRITNQQL